MITKFISYEHSILQFFSKLASSSNLTLRSILKCWQGTTKVLTYELRSCRKWGETHLRQSLKRFLYDDTRVLPFHSFFPFSQLAFFFSFSSYTFLPQNYISFTTYFSSQIKFRIIQYHKTRLCFSFTCIIQPFSRHQL